MPCELAARERMLATIFSEAGDAIVLLDPQTLRFEEYNEAVLRMLGYTRAELAHQDLASLQANVGPSGYKIPSPPTPGS